MVAFEALERLEAPNARFIIQMPTGSGRLAQPWSWFLTH